MKKKFKDEAEIIALIDRYLVDIREVNDKIGSTNHLADHLRGTCEASRIPGLRADCDRMSNEVAWREGRLDTLKEILAEFRTLELPFNKLNELDIPADTSVEVPE